MLEFPMKKKNKRRSTKCNHGIVPLSKSLFLNPLIINGFSRFPVQERRLYLDDIFGTCQQQFKRLMLFSGNDYLGLSSHPAVRKPAVKAAQEYRMGPRDSALICGNRIYLPP
ncbi:hypothetical protein PTKIN_Ptkin05aG0221100 [Pterospermum kingtungense]